MSISVDSISEKTFDNFKKITPALVALIVTLFFLLFQRLKILEKKIRENLKNKFKKLSPRQKILCFNFYIVKIRQLYWIRIQAIQYI